MGVSEHSEKPNLQVMLKTMLPEDLAFSVVNLTTPREANDVFASEAAAIAQAVPNRRAEFLAGRVAAHQAMRSLGMSPTAVPMGKDRAPIWPLGLVGSISHCREKCVALVAKASSYRAVSVDIEPDSDLPDDLISIVCLPSELESLMELPKADRGQMARLIFSAKETAYKLQYPLTGKMLEFSDVEVAVDFGGGNFEARFDPSLGAVLSAPQLKGRFGRAEGKIVCLMHVR